MMDLTVEIHGDAGSLEECLRQFTVQECLHGENMYKCDGYGCFSFLIRFTERMKKKKYLILHTVLLALVG